MSQENVEAHKRAIEASNRRDLDTILALAHEQVVVEPRRAAMEGGFDGYDGCAVGGRTCLRCCPTPNLKWSRSVTSERLRSPGCALAATAPGVPLRWKKSSGRSAGGVAAATPWGRNCMREKEALEAAGLSE